MGVQLNRIVKSIAPKSLFDDMSNVIGAATTFKQGDFLVLTSNLLVAVTSGELGTNFVGIARASVTLGLPVQPVTGTDVDASVQPVPLAGPVYGVTAKCVAKTGDAFAPGCLVYIDGNAGTHHVTSTAGSSKCIGVYQGANVASASAGQELECLIGAVYPNATPAF